MSVLKSELVIQGSDKTGAAFAGVMRHAEQLKSMLAGMKDMGIGDAGIERANRALREQTRLLRGERVAAQEVARAHAIANDALIARTGIIARMQKGAAGVAHMSGAGWMVGGLASGRLAHSVAHDTSEYLHQRAMMSVGGMSPAEVSDATDKAMGMRVLGMSAADNMRAISELRMVFGSTAHAIEHVETVQRAAASLKAINPEINAENEAYNLARSLELKGVSNDPAHFLRLQNMMVQAINASHGKITGSDYMSFTSRAGTGTTSTLSDFFYTRIAPTLMQEMRPETAGRALATMRRQLLGGHMQLQSASEWMNLGLVDKNKVELDKIGHVKKIKPGAIVDADLFSQDPYAWVQAYLAPALKKKGIVTDEKIAAEMATLFSDRYAENMATILLKQKQRIEKDAGLASKGAGLDDVDKLRGTDPLAASRDLAASVQTMLAAFGGPLAGPAIAAMNSLSDWAHGAGKWYSGMAKDHPAAGMAASGAGALGLGYVGFKGAQATYGLIAGRGAATAAVEGAAEIAAAAAGVKVLGLTASGPVSSVAGGAGGGWLGRLLGLAAGVPLAAAGIYFGSTEEANAGEQDIYRRGKDGKMALTPFGLSMRDGAPADGWPAAAGARGGDVSGALPNVKAELTGDANIKVGVEVKTEPGFWLRVSSAVSNGINNVRINGPDGSTGSVGKTMPEASSAP